MLQGLSLFVCVVCVFVCPLLCFVYVCGGCEVLGDVVWCVFGCVFCCVCVCFCVLLLMYCLMFVWSMLCVFVFVRVVDKGVCVCFSQFVVRC